ncbi:hypothetical protein [Limnobacter sp.]|uniref:hypothetical protein n=1 Tax=Limnobacter sp. TaxID=2003368 RepID=UPI0025C135F6|nr:hypothetical protein [Limnobacter sp.]
MSTNQLLFSGFPLKAEISQAIGPVRFFTGLADLDLHLGGGFKPGAAYLFRGEMKVSHFKKLKMSNAIFVHDPLGFCEFHAILKKAKMLNLSVVFMIPDQKLNFPGEREALKKIFDQEESSFDAIGNFSVSPSGKQFITYKKLRSGLVPVGTEQRVTKRSSNHGL